MSSSRNVLNEKKREREKCGDGKNGISTMLEPDFNPLDINCILQLNGYFVASRHLTEKKNRNNNTREEREERTKRGIHKSTNFSYKSLSTFTSEKKSSKNNRIENPKLESCWICIDHYYNEQWSSMKWKYNQKSVKTSTTVVCRYIQIYSTQRRGKKKFPIYKVIFHSDVNTHTHKHTYGL